MSGAARERWTLGCTCWTLIGRAVPCWRPRAALRAWCIRSGSLRPSACRRKRRRLRRLSCRWTSPSRRCICRRRRTERQFGTVPLPKPLAVAAGETLFADVRFPIESPFAAITLYTPPTETRFAEIELDPAVVLRGNEVEFGEVELPLPDAGFVGTSINPSIQVHISDIQPTRFRVLVTKTSGTAYAHVRLADWPGTARQNHLWRARGRTGGGGGPAARRPRVGTDCHPAFYAAGESGAAGGGRLAAQHGLRSGGGHRDGPRAGHESLLCNDGAGAGHGGRPPGRRRGRDDAGQRDLVDQF